MILFSLLFFISTIFSPVFSYPIRGPICHTRRGDGCQCSELADERLCYCTGITIKEVPQNLWSNVTRLTMRCVGIEKIQRGDFDMYLELNHIEILQVHTLQLIESGVFPPLRRLKKLSIKDCSKLDLIEGYLVDGNRELMTLEMQRTAIKSIPKIKTVMNTLSPPVIDFAENEITGIANDELNNLHVYGLRLSRNRISHIAPFAFKNSRIHILNLDDNPLTDVSPSAFSGIKELNKLDLSYTELESLPEEGLGQIEMLVAENTPNLKHLPPLVAFVNLKEARLHYPYHCCLFKYAPASQKNLKQYTKNYAGNLQELREKHCIAQDTTTTSRSISTTSLSARSSVIIPESKKKVHSNAKIKYKQGLKTANEPDSTEIPENRDNLGHVITDFEQPARNRVKRTQKSTNHKWDTLGQFGIYYEYEEEEENGESESPPDGQIVLRSGKSRDTGFLWGDWFESDEEYDAQIIPKNRRPVTPAHVDHGFWETAAVSVAKLYVPCADGDREINDYYANITCSPQPDALNPCEDVMIGWHLRIVIFFVWIASIVGNVLVLVVLFLTTQPRQRVNNFLMFNLALADLFTGIYLAMLALIDVSTKGEYYNFAVAWQTGWGCKIAGTLTVFASELSIVTMVMISFEVWYNTKYALLQQRLSLSMVVPIMVFGWLGAIGLSTLPLMDISDYSVTSTCLPLRLQHLRDRIYLITCLSLNVLGFGYIVFNYVSVYCMIAKSTAATTHTQDMALAKLMFCLIFTDFLSWAPTVFFGLTAAAQIPLISISVAKVFLVIFFPINAFANPWLYVFLTKRFRKNLSRFIRKHVWLQEFLSNTLRRNHSPHFLGNSDNFFYQSHPQNGTQMTQMTSQRSSPSTCSSAVVTPRGSRASLPHSDTTPRSGSSDSGNEITFPTENSTLLAPLNSPGPISSPKNDPMPSNLVVPRRKSTTRFRPQMSDIIENSNSNSTEDDQKHSPGQKSIMDSTSQLIASLIGRRRGSRKDEELAENCFELESFGLKNPPDTSAGDCVSIESGYCTITPLLTPQSSNSTHQKSQEELKMISE